MIISVQLYVAGFWRGRARGVDDDGSSKTPLFAQKRKEVLCLYVLLLRFFSSKGLRRVMCILDFSPLW